MAECVCVIKIKTRATTRTTRAGDREKARNTKDKDGGREWGVT